MSNQKKSASKTQENLKDVQILSCYLHVDKPFPNVKIMNFDNQSWDRVKTVAEYRLSRTKSNKYKKVCENLPQAFDEFVGYHSDCYKQFTAVSKTVLDKYSAPQQEQSSCTLRSSIAHISDKSSSSGVFRSECLFCGLVSKGKKREQLGNCESLEAAEKIKEAAEILNDKEMITKISNVDFVAKEVKYHHSCRKNYLNTSARSFVPRTASDIGHVRQVHENAFSSVCDYIKTCIIGQREATTLASLYQDYISIISENGIDCSLYDIRYFETKLLSHFTDCIKIDKLQNKTDKILYSCTLDRDDVVGFHNAFSHNSKVTETAYQLRNAILQLAKKHPDLPNPLTVDALQAGQANPPEILTHFFKILYTGSSNKEPSDRMSRYIRSASEDALFAVTNGEVKPSKHLCLGMGLKSITGSRKVIEILNHLGHSVGYHVTETIENDLALNISNKNCITPDSLLKLSGLSTGTAWDNYDENTETLSGSDTLHDTVGICYQNVSTDNVPEQTGTIAPQPSTVRPKHLVRKRSLDIEDPTLEPYKKRPKIKDFRYPVKVISDPINLSESKRRDFIWSICHFLYSNIPMWSGWNSLTMEDHLPKQVIGYMDNLSLPPTRLDVVLETLRRSQAVATECSENTAIVHYDLAIAKPAMQIQSQESPKFDNVFICFGPFHIMLAYFGALGKVIDHSGGPYILTESKVLADGSLNGFIKGKHFNRCQRMHSLLSLAFRILHFQSFVAEYGDISVGLQEKLLNLTINPSPAEMQNVLELDELNLLFQKYVKFSNETKTGKHGSTAQFWYMYIELVELFLLFSRSCRTNDLPLFTYCLGRMCAVFFAANRPNYARWMTKYHLNLLNIDITHPEAREMLQNGGLSIRRSSKSFSRIPVDMTLEQTVNADAASRLTGISAFTQSYNARRRWMITRSVRSAIVGSLLSKAGIKPKADVNQDLNPSRLERNNKDVNNLIETILSTSNPFDPNMKTDDLLCISTGHKINKDVKQEILSFVEYGEECFQSFRDGCFADPSRFEKPIARNKMRQFSSAAIKVPVEVKDKKIIQLRCSRDLFGRLLFLATVTNIDLEKVFEYPLTAVPPSMAQIDGSMNKTDKSKLMKLLENKVHSTAPSANEINVYVVDAMFLIQSYSHFPDTFGGVAKTILTCICKLAKHVHFVCDTYVHPSIKDIERELRGESSGLDILVTGSKQKRPHDFRAALHSAKFKNSLLSFLQKEWQDQSYSHILRDHDIYFAHESKCHHFYCSDNNSNIVCDEVPDLTSSHEEADSRMAFHIHYITSSFESPNIVVRSNDTDVLIILLYHCSKLNANVWMDSGNDSNNTRRMIDLKKISTEIGSEMCEALPAIHAFSGCDYTAAFLRKGKTRPYNIIEKNTSYRSVFRKIGNENSVTETDTKIVEAFVCELYGKKAFKAVNEARFAIFREKYAPTNEGEPLEKLKGADPSSLPPSQMSLKQKILRTNYVAYLWKHANCSNPALQSPNENGWKFHNGKYIINWFEGEQIPKDIRINIEDKQFTDDDIEHEGDLSDGECFTDTDSDSD